MILKHKKILFISVSFFGYEKAIISKLKELGAEVDFYDDRPSNAAWYKAMIRFNKRFMDQPIRSYYAAIAKEVEQKNYDYFFAIKGEAIPREFILNFKKKHPQTQCIYYTFDPICEHPLSNNFLSLFHKTFSFDPDDAKTLESEFLPLFYIDIYEKGNTSENLNDKKYDLCCIGSTHTDRYLVISRLKKNLSQASLRWFCYFYAPSRLIFFLRKIFDREMKKFSTEDIYFSSLSHKEIFEIYKKSKAVVDINKPYQKGLTIRTFEVLATQCKLVTTNEAIKKYPFYSSDNILVIDREQPKIPLDFLQTEFCPIPQSIMKKYALEEWVKKIFTEYKS